MIARLQQAFVLFFVLALAAWLAWQWPRSPLCAVLGALLLWLVRPDAHPYVAAALSAYAAVIVSFLGGIHWGLGFRAQPADPSRFVWGVVPSLVAWVAVVMPPYAGLVVHGVMLIVCYGVDRRIYPVQAAAAWLTLRFRLTTVASLSCFIGAAGS